MKIFDDFLTRAHDRFRFVAKKTGGPDVLLEFGRMGVGEGVGVRIFFIKRFGNFVDADIGALRRENGRNEQLEGIGVNQFAGGTGIGLLELVQNDADAFRVRPFARFRPGVGRNLRTASDFTAFPALLAVFGCWFDVFFFDWLMSLKNIAQRMRGTPREQIAESSARKGKS